LDSVFAELTVGVEVHDVGEVFQLVGFGGPLNGVFVA